MSTKPLAGVSSRALDLAGANLRRARPAILPKNPRSVRSAARQATVMSARVLAPALARGAGLIGYSLRFMGPGLATGLMTLAARAVVIRAGGWSDVRSALRLDSLLRSRLGPVVVPTLLAIGHGMTRSLGSSLRLETAVICALSAAGALGLHLGGSRGGYEGEAALPLAAMGVAVGCGLWTSMAPVARAALAV